MTGKSKKATDTLSQHPLNLDSSLESDTDSDEVDVISCSSDRMIDLHLNGTKVSSDLKTTIQRISCVIEPLVEEKGQQEIQDPVK